MKSTAAFVGLAAASATFALARQQLDVSHEPITALFTADGIPSHPNFLQSRWESSDLPLDFRKRSLSGTASKRSNRSNKTCRADKSKKHDSHAAHRIHSTLNQRGQQVSSWIQDGKYHDHSLGIVINKAIDNSADNEWLVNVGFGTQPQSLKVVFDSGSPDTWVYSPACCYANNHTFFNPTQSSTYHNRTVVNNAAVAAPDATPGQSWSSTYGSGSSVSGYVGLDTFTFGQQRLKVDSLPLALVTNLTGSRASRGMEGLIGLSAGSGSYTEGGWTTPFEAMSSRGLIHETYLTATLRKANRNTGRGGGGRYTFGEIDDDHLAGNITWTRALSPYLWAGYFDQMTIGNQTLAAAPGTNDRPIRFMIDTGSAVLYLPPPIVQQINGQIYGSYVANTSSSGLAFPYLIPCDTGLKRHENKYNNPVFNLKLNGTNFSIPKEDYVFYANQPVPAAAAGGKQNMCYSAFQTGPAQISIIGLSFIKNHVVVFDQGGKNLTTSARRIGLGQRTDIKYDH
ncbi:related to pepsinogen precursor [Melanopsichium pennsylvanicum]|uniref:Related to pepsinogen n=2 Tax=Melanopsichium pennsylvanicum TaxID=63383 RepID=A0AAJ4XMS4_9BASI|nr:related to pepsinogen precursor [Melanopsichium pennsylvanicum 4]SNX85132.1 related to pepsinogen precursor [Melanopsichium pennsylvanicum]